MTVIDLMRHEMTTQLQTVAARSDVASDTTGTQQPKGYVDSPRDEIDRHVAGLRALLDVTRVCCEYAEGYPEDDSLGEVMCLARRELDRIYAAVDRLERGEK
jgi:hypothetical protein